MLLAVLQPEFHWFSDDPSTFTAISPRGGTLNQSNVTAQHPTLSYVRSMPPGRQVIDHTDTRGETVVLPSRVVDHIGQERVACIGQRVVDDKCVLLDQRFHGWVCRHSYAKLPAS